MRFLLKCIFWLGGVFLLMPGIMGKQADNPASPPQSSRAVQTTPQTQPDQNAPADLVEQWLQAGKTLQEISTFCDRNPAICMAGKATAQQAGEQALLRAKDALDSFSAPAAQQQPAQSPAAQSVLVRIPVPTPRPQ
ncbi:DUF5330 domain-containing protein [Ochrobactrum sp. MR28]|nr:DUF5330 domain-containing protein [Ochrobactrum sp. MR28]MBX8815978.1 DUF5330 domain-containing protein [Ochrobactrum sp. MR31]